MKIAIIGTRGIPNNYGGFEQFAEYLSQYLVKSGHMVTVYNSHSHLYQEKKWNGVDILHCYDPEDKIGTAGQFIYDLNCILDTRKKNYDIILQLGYTSSSVWGKLLPKHSIIITNMDGLEWKRSKYSKKVQKFLMWAEKLAVKTSNFLVSDSIGIQDYIQKKYNLNSRYIAYGAHIFDSPEVDILIEHQLAPYGYDMLIARLEPENSIEIILDGVNKVQHYDRKFLVVGNHNSKYGEYLKHKFKDNANIVFKGSIYDINVLNNLRYYSNVYFHGHTVGGTNPSLLEAMASSSLICANDNLFNKSILGENAYYFSTSEDVAKILTVVSKESEQASKSINMNLNSIKTKFEWNKINGEYLDYFHECLTKFTKKTRLPVD